MFCVSSDLNSGKKVRVFHFGGGVLCKVRSELRKESESFSFSRGGGVLCKLRSELRKESNSFSFLRRVVFCTKFQNRGVLLKFGQNFLEA